MKAIIGLIPFRIMYLLKNTFFEKLFFRYYKVLQKGCSNIPTLMG